MLVLLAEIHRANLAMPPVAKASLATAWRYWVLGVGTPDDLEAARIDCWSYLDSNTPEAASHLSCNHVVRCVLCLLEPVGDQEQASMTADWFADLLNAIPE